MKLKHENYMAVVLKAYSFEKLTLKWEYIFKFMESFLNLLDEDTKADLYIHAVPKKGIRFLTEIDGNFYNLAYIKPYNEENWKDLKEKATEHKIAFINIKSNSHTLSGKFKYYVYPFQIDARLDDAENVIGKTYGVSVSFNKKMYESKFIGTMPDLLKELAVNIGAFKGITDYCGETGIGDGTWLETYSKRVNEKETLLKSYYWGHILTERHISALGGMKSIKENAPCFLAEEISINKQTCVIFAAH